MDAGEVGARVQAARKARGLTQPQVGAQPTVSDLETGKGDPKLSTLLAVAAALHANPAWFLDPSLSPDDVAALVRAVPVSSDREQSAINRQDAPFAHRNDGTTLDDPAAIELDLHRRAREQGTPVRGRLSRHQGPPLSREAADVILRAMAAFRDEILGAIGGDEKPEGDAGGDDPSGGEPKPPA